LLTGRGTTLQGLAQLANAHALKPLEMHEAPPRNYDVSRFYGDASRAEALLGWKSEIDIEAGFAGLTDAYRTCLV
jgi:dTDP-glucose 4,6-dehydratase/UDP-glucose 4-epimerase